MKSKVNWISFSIILKWKRMIFCCCIFDIILYNAAVDWWIDNSNGGWILIDFYYIFVSWFVLKFIMFVIFCDVLWNMSANRECKFEMIFIGCWLLCYRIVCWKWDGNSISEVEYSTLSVFFLHTYFLTLWKCQKICKLNTDNWTFNIRNKKSDENLYSHFPNE